MIYGEKKEDLLTNLRSLLLDFQLVVIVNFLAEFVKLSIADFSMKFPVLDDVKRQVYFKVCISKRLCIH